MTKIDTSTWKEFTYSALFDLKTVTEKLDKLSLSDNGTIPVYSSETSNNGIIGYTENEASFIVNEENPIYVIFGDHTRAFHIVTESFCVTDNVKVLKPKVKNKKVLSFITTVWNRSIPNMGYSRHWSTAKEVVFKLPVKTVIEPDWFYMENYMKEIENRVNVSLTALQRVRVITPPMNIKEWKPFKVDDLFEIYPTKSYKETNVTLFEEGDKNTVIVNSSFNNGIGGYTNKEVTEKVGIITFSDTTTADSIFYQYKDFVGYAHVQGVHPVGVFKDCWDKNSLQFFTSVFKSSAKGKNYDYANKFTRKSASNLIVYLPAKFDGSPDFDYLGQYIESVCRGKCSQGVDNIDNLIGWRKIKVGDLFDIKNGKNYLKMLEMRVIFLWLVQVAIIMEYLII